MTLTKANTMHILHLAMLLCVIFLYLPLIVHADDQAALIEETLKKIDPRITSLSGVLDRYPPAIKDESEREKIESELKSVIEELEKLSLSAPDDPSVELRIGECYRLGHNLDLDGAWESSEKHLKRAIELKPDLAKAHMVLGVLYVNTSPEFVIAAEKEFVKALEAAKGKPQPSAHSGLCFAYYYQGKFKEAVEQADKYLALVPDDEALKQLRKIAFEKASGGEPPRTIETGLAQQSVSFAENSIAASGSVMRFAPPDDAHWKLTKKEYDKKRGAGRIVYKHLPIKDPQGHEIEPLMAVIFEEMSAFLDAGTYSESKRAQNSMDWQEKRKFTSQDGSLSYPNAEGYDGEYTVQGVIHKIIVAYMVHKELGVQIICDSTDGVYDKVESDFRAFIKSINFE